MCFRTTPSLYTYSLDGLSFFINRARNQLGFGRFWVASIQLEFLSYRIACQFFVLYHTDRPRKNKRNAISGIVRGFGEKDGQM